MVPLVEGVRIGVEHPDGAVRDAQYEQVKREDRCASGRQEPLHQGEVMVAQPAEPEPLPNRERGPTGGFR